MRTDVANTHWFDRYSVIHAAWGVAFEASKVPDAIAIGSHIAFEAAENAVKRVSVQAWPDARPDAIQNQVGDVLSFTTGYYVARALKKSFFGPALMTGFVAAGAAIWMVNILALQQKQ